MADQIRIITMKKGTTVEWGNERVPLEAGEIGYDSTADEYKGGDGVSAFQSLSPFATKAHVNEKTPEASETVKGIVELATLQEATAGTDTTRVLTPATGGSRTTLAATSTTNATSTTAAPLKSAGGLAIVKDVIVGGRIKCNNLENGNYYTGTIDLGTLAAGIGNQKKISGLTLTNGRSLLLKIRASWSVGATGGYHSGFAEWVIGIRGSMAQDYINITKVFSFVSPSSAETAIKDVIEVMIDSTGDDRLKIRFVNQSDLYQVVANFRAVIEVLGVPPSPIVFTVDE